MKSIGIIGLSEGNGHPFSYGSIINGYSPDGLAPPDGQASTITFGVATRQSSGWTAGRSRMLGLRILNPQRGYVPPAGFRMRVGDYQGFSG